MLSRKALKAGERGKPVERPLANEARDCAQRRTDTAGLAARRLVEDALGKKNRRA
jgi:hypothetical protein